MWADRIVDSDLARRAVDDGVASTADLHRMRRGWQEWAAAEDGWLLVPHGEILASPPYGPPTADRANPADSPAAG
jgi:hypothetical protein